MWRKPTIADIYVEEVRTRLDPALVPVFPPDTADVRVGTVARFEHGSFRRRRHLEDILGGPTAFQHIVPLAPPTAPTKSTFVSQGRVSLVASGIVNLGGQDRVAARLHFDGDRAVVASYHNVVERAVQQPRSLDDLLWKLYIEGTLSADEVVVSVHRRAEAGTVMVNRKGGLDVQLSVDPSLVTGPISFANLSAGVEFGAGSQASWQTSGPNLIVAVMVKGLSRRGDEIEDRRGFQSLEGARVEDYLGSQFPVVTSGTVVYDADFDRLDDDD